MIKSRLDFKLINIALIAVICYFVYQSLDLWINILNKFIDITLPLFLGFILAYALSPALNYLEKHKIPKYFGIFIIILIILLIIITLFILLIPLSNQILSFINSILIFINNINSNILNILNKVFNQILIYISNGLFKTINTSINVITDVVIMLVSCIYFLLDMNKIRSYIKKYLKNKSIKLYNYIKTIDLEIKKYIQGFLKITFISFFEYTCFYYFMGHPNALLLGILAALSNFIPYFGGMIVQILAVVTALVIDPTLGLKIAVLSLILGLFDSYILNPYVYGKTNELHPIIVITSIFAGGILFGFFGVIISLPLSIIIVTSLKFYFNKQNVYY